MLLYAVAHGGWGLGVSGFLEKSVTKVYGSMLLALRGVGGVKFPGKKCYATHEWPPNPNRGAR